jgi:hypothetical protein
MEGWGDFFLGELGASAALGGLLFVAISLNLTRILSVPSLPDRALAALGLLLAILTVSSFMLIPGQPAMLIGLETLIVGIALAALGIRVMQRSRRDTQSHPDSKFGINAVMFAIAILPYIAGGIVMLAGELDVGLYFVAAAIVFSFLKAVLDAWVLLVEINR